MAFSTIPGASEALKGKPTLSLQQRAEEAAAIRLQAAWRRVLAARLCEQKRSVRRLQEARAQAITVKVAGERVSCPLDQLASTIDVVAFVEERVPFLHSTTDATHQELLRYLSFAPGFTLNRHSEADMQPSRLREVLVAALRDGLTIILDLDPPKKMKSEDEVPPVQEICNPNHFPAELFSKPSAIFTPDVYGPLQGRAGVQAAAHFELLGIDSEASADEIKAAYRGLVKTAHPDKGGDPEKFLAIQAAYEALTSGDNATIATSSSGDAFEPSSSFKLLLISRRYDSPPPDVAAHCTPIWISGKQSILMKGYDKKMEALPCKATSALGILAELAAEQDFRDHQEFMKDREFEDDAEECWRRFVLNEKRILKEQRRLRRQLFTEAVKLRAGNSSGEQEALGRLEDAQRRLDSVIEDMQNEAERIKEADAALAKFTNEVNMEQDALEEARKKLAQTEKTASQKRYRIPSRLSSLETKRNSLAAKKTEAKVAKGEAQEAMQQEVEKLSQTVADAEDMQKQFEEYVQQLEGSVEQMKGDISRSKDALVKQRLELSKQQKAHAKQCFEAQTRIWKLTQVFEDEAKEAQTKAKQDDDADANLQVSKTSTGAIDETVFKRVHHAVYSKNEGNSLQLVDAAGEGNMDQVIELLEKGYDLESRDSSGYTALSDACCMGQETIAKLFLDLGADPNTFGGTGDDSHMFGTLGNGTRRTPLWRATFNGHLSVMQLLLEHGADPCFVLSGNYALMDAPKAAKELLGSWADKAGTEELQQGRQKRLEGQLEEFVNTWSCEERQSYHVMRTKAQLQKLAGDGDAEKLKELLNEVVCEEAEAGRAEGPELTAEVRDECGRTLLHIASWKGHAQVVEMLLSNWKTVRTNGDTPHAEMRQRVLKVDVDARFGPWNRCDGWTALGVAGFAGHADVVEVLRRHGANPLLGTQFHEDAFAIMDGAPAPGGAIVVKSIDSDHMITTERKHGLSMGSAVIYKCGPNTQSPMMEVLMMSKELVKPCRAFFARVHGDRTLTLYDTHEHAVSGQRQYMHRMYSGEGTFLVEWEPVHTSMKEYQAIGNGCGQMEFLCDRQPIPVVQTKEKLKQLEAQQAKKRLEIEGARALDAKINPPEDEGRSPSGFYIGAFVRLSASGCEVEADYDWSKDPLRPGEVGEVQEPDPEEEAGDSEVYVVGPRGDPAFYAPGDIELVRKKCAGLPSSRAPAAVQAPAPQQSTVQRPEDSSFYNLKLAGSCVPRSFGPPRG